MPTPTRDDLEDEAAAKVLEMFNQAISALTILYGVSPERAKVVTRFMVDGFANLTTHMGN